MYFISWNLSSIQIKILNDIMCNLNWIEFKLFLNWIQIFKLNSNTLNEIKIQLTRNGMQIGAKDVENLRRTMVLKRKKLQKDAYIWKYIFPFLFT
jgi:hypothetical protein